MVVLGTRVLQETYFALNHDITDYECDDETSRMMNKIVAKDKIRVTTQKIIGGQEYSKSIDIVKKFITSHDIARGLVTVERDLRKITGNDPDHIFFEGWFCTVGDQELICMRFGS